MTKKCKIQQKIAILSLFLEVMSAAANAQNTSMHGDTILADRKPVMILELQSFDHYIISSLHNERLFEIHNTTTEIKHQQVWLITFLHDKKKAAFTIRQKNKLVFPNLIYNAHLLAGNKVDSVAEQKFIATHPVPKGYVDVDELINY